MTAGPCRKMIKLFRKMAFRKATLMGYIVPMGMFAEPGLLGAQAVPWFISRDRPIYYWT